MSEDKVIAMTATEIPGMKISFQGPVSPDGKVMQFELVADALVLEGWLDERLDTIAGVLRRQSAIEELPLCKQSIVANRKLLETAKKERAAAVARQDGRIANLNQRRRAEVMPTPNDVNTVAQHDARILQIEGQIEQATARIPYLQAIIERREPPDIYVLASDRPEAAD